MSIQIELPHVGESVTEGVIGKWLKNIGDTVEKYEPLLEVVTDKVNMEVPSPFNGKLTAILVEEGEVVPMGTPIAEMDADGVDAGEVVKEPETKEETSSEIIAPASSAGIFLKDVKPVGPTGSGEEPEIPPDLLAKLGSPEAQTTPQKTDNSNKVRYSPVVKKLAAEKNIDLSKIKGTGLGGRVTKEDVINYSPTDSAVKSTTTGQAPVIINAQEDETELKLTPLRRIIAENMVKSNEIPQAWSYHEVDVTNLVLLRKNIRQNFIQKEGVDITYLPFVIKVVADALKSNPLLNSSLTSVPGHLGATIITVMSSLILIPSSTILKP